jgi:hypothetical protein
MKKIFTILLVLITSVCLSQNIKFYDNNYYRTDKSIMLDKPQHVAKLHPAAYNMTLRSNDDNIKTIAVVSYVLINSFAITTYAIMNDSYKDRNHDDGRNYQPGYPDIDKNLNPIGMISTVVISSGLLVTILVSF